MSLVALIITIIIGFWFSNAADAFPQILWGWVRWPNWLIWLLLLMLMSWFMKGDDNELGR
ncbi:MAG: hypothetical protein HLUCCA11_14585 [Phormidesmis priestleyi Ana]|uniref:Uncharacterized protein n=1 Tax=Phormidesmis priestleyi Ana TaxID=1666911 RepID=A0A0P8DE65_9CYAN|nr:MAG: hypothetical protein HLUCCA11_14585 [Phormidesmis priestleyi Ana]